MKKDKTMDKSDKDYVYDSLIDIQATVDDLVEYMEDDDSYEEEENKRNIGEEIAEFIFLFGGGVVTGIILQATFNLLQQL